MTFVTEKMEEGPITPSDSFSRINSEGYSGSSCDESEEFRPQPLPAHGRIPYALTLCPRFGSSRQGMESFRKTYVQLARIIFQSLAGLMGCGKPATLGFPLVQYVQQVFTASSPVSLGSLGAGRLGISGTVDLVHASTVGDVE